jgi:tetratricopeptide (TPR) repeat protein
LLARLERQHTLLVLDNAETLVEAVEQGDPHALDLVQLLSEGLPAGRTTLLVTSRTLLDFAGEEGISLGGLLPEERAQLFRQYTGSRRESVETPLARSLSERVAGHPLCLRLLGGAFASSATPLADFVAEYEARLVAAADRYRSLDHRHRTLYASIETSVRSLDDNLRRLLAGLWVFHGWFPPEIVEEIFTPPQPSPRAEREQMETPPQPSPRAEREQAETPPQSSPHAGGVSGGSIPDHLHALWRRGLLARQERSLRDGGVLLYRLLPSTRPYVEDQLLPVMGLGEEARADLLAGYGAAYRGLARLIYRDIDRSATLVHIAQQARDDLERGLEHVEGLDRARYHLHWGWILQRLGSRLEGLRHTERALAAAQGQDQGQRLELEALNNMAMVYQSTGRMGEALATLVTLVELARSIHSPAIEAGVWGNMAGVLLALDRRTDAIDAQRQAVAIMERYNLSHDAGGASLPAIRSRLAALESGASSAAGSADPATLPPQVQQTLVEKTVAVLTALPEKRDEWRGALSQGLQDAQTQGAAWQIEVDLFTALLSLLDGEAPHLPSDHPYRSLLDTAVARVGAAAAPSRSAAALPADFAVHCAQALAGEPGDKIALYNDLEQLARSHPSHVALFQALRDAIFTPDPAQLTPSLAGHDATLWLEILAQLQPKKATGDQ